MSSTDGSDPWAGFKLWYYTPSIAAGAIFGAIFIILTALHVYRLAKSRTWFCIPFVVGALFEAVGYIFRAVAHNNMTSTPIYVIQYLLILISPALFAASIYMILGRLVRATRAESYCIIRVTWLTKIFVAGDVTCFFIQSAGGGLMAIAKTASELKNYQDIILGGLILQVVMFLFFLAVAGIFHSRLRQRPTAKSQDPELPWERYMLMLYTVSVLVTVRNLFRVIEYGLGNNGYLLTHEWTLYVFDGVLMAVVLAICLVWYVPSIRPKQAASYEAMGMGMEQQAVEPKQSPV